jgi:branched-chain amino acid transport system ATP-binding protein
MLKVESLETWYGQTQVLWRVDIDVRAGEMIGILGRNGAGKTTLLRTIAGLQPRSRGTITLDGSSILGTDATDIARAGLSFVREGGRMASSLTVHQHLMVGRRLAKLRGRPGLSLDDIWRTFPLLEPLQTRHAGLLSGGQRQALALAVSYISDPKVILIDEPSAGLAPKVAFELFQTLKALADAGTTLLVVEQQPAWLIGLAHRGYLLELGKIAKAGTVQDMIAEAA